MRFSELSIQTQRSAPSEIRMEGQALLYRAGYLSRSGEFLALGQLAIEKLRRSAQSASDLPGFFSRLGLSTAHALDLDEYYVLFENTGSNEPAGKPGRDGLALELLVCPGCGYAARREVARSHRQPFSIEAALPLEKLATPECSTITQLAQFMQISPQKTAKALMFTRLQDSRFVFVVVRGDMQLSEAKLRAVIGDFRLATADEINAAGAVAGYASPVGLRGALIVLDELVARSPNLVAGANEHGYHLKNTNYPRDYQADLVADLTQVTAGEACPDCSAALEGRPGVQVYAGGQVLFEKLLLSLAELYHDEKGLILPAAAAPLDVYLMNVPGKNLDTGSAAEELYTQLGTAGLSVLFDDRDERAGVKFNDADLIGCPVRLTVGERGLQNGLLEVKYRQSAENKQIPFDTVLSEISPSSSGRD